MSTLRVYLEFPPDPARETEWALFDDANRVVRRGRAPIAGWPSADSREAVIAAAHGRLATVKLPPLPPPRVQSAASFALEDQLAGAPEDSHVAPGRQAADGSLRVAIVGAAWIRAFQAASKRCAIRWQRVLLESDLATPPAGGWCWCAESLEHAGFVRIDGGSSISVGPSHGAGLPEELALALAGSGRRPPLVRVNVAGVDQALLERARAQTGVEFTTGPPWHWSGAEAAAFDTAIDLQVGAFDTGSAAPRTDVVRLFRPALWILGAALAIYVLAGAGEWLSLQWQLGAVDREMSALAQVAVGESVGSAGAGVPPTVAIARRHGELRHRAGLAASNDLLPLLARAAPAMSTIPAGAVRSLHYADGHVVFELQKLDPAQTTRLQRELQQQGLVAIAVPTANGARLRIGLD
ncbi:MAG TPA: type II secretion system protein GspL [Casimicrobiaceae bacterium]|jgi:type II secretion system protein L|nr:type II secretion system protein GspL [Casimicrobiaceae bacterium]